MAALAQYLFQNNFFICPPNGYQEYANIVLYTPMLTLFIISLMIHPSFVDLLKKQGRKNMFSCKRRNYPNVLQDQQSRKRFWVKIIHNIIFAMIPSMVWITMCLLRKNIYACSKVGATIYNNKTEVIQLKVDYHRAESMKVGFTLLQIFSAVLIISTLIKNAILQTTIDGEFLFYLLWSIFLLTRF